MERYPLPRTPARLLGFVVIGLLLALACYALTTYALAQEFGVDVRAYLGAAERLRQGEPLYAMTGSNASEQYRYSPWFAFAWIPLTWLDAELVAWGWVALMTGAAVLSVVPLLRHGWVGLGLAALLGPLQLQGAIFGNVQPALVLMLMWGIERRSGPFWVAVGASLKAVPLLLVIVYAGRREWGKVALATGFTAVLVGPTLLFDLSGYSVEPGPNQMSLAAVWLPAFIGTALAAAALVFLAARTPYRWLAGAFAMLAALPRLLTYEIGFLLVGVGGDTPVRGRQGGS